MGRTNYILLSALVVTLSSATFAQTKPGSTSVPEDATVTSPRWNRHMNPTSQDSNSLAGIDQLVTQTVTAVPQARADAVVAKWTFRKADHDLTLASNFKQNDFRDSAEYDQAFGDFQIAYDEYEAARGNALAGLRKDDRYQAVESLRKNVSEQIADELEQKEPDAEKLVSLASLKLDSIAQFRQQERDILAADQNVVAARRQLVAAGKKLAKVERDFARTMRNDETLATLRKSREEARIVMLASAAYLDETRTARDIALRYAYVARGYDRYVPRVADCGYGYGYGNGFYGYGGVGYPVVVGSTTVPRLGTSGFVSTTNVPFHTNAAGGIIR